MAFVREIHRCPMNYPHKGPVTRKMFPFDDIIMSVHDYKQFNHGDDVNEGDEIGKNYNEYSFCSEDVSETAIFESFINNPTFPCIC